MNGLRLDYGGGEHGHRAGRDDVARLREVGGEHRDHQEHHADTQRDLQHPPQDVGQAQAIFWIRRRAAGPAG